MPLNIPSNEDNKDNFTTAIVSFILIRDPSGNTVPYQYILQLHGGSTFTKTLTEMDVIADSSINKTRVNPNPSLPVVDSLPARIQHSCKLT